MRKSTKQPAKKVLPKGKKPWLGDNVKYGTVFGGEESGMSPFGINELGEIIHFDSR